MLQQVRIETSRLWVTLTIELAYHSEPWVTKNININPPKKVERKLPINSAKMPTNIEASFFFSWFDIVGRRVDTTSQSVSWLRDLYNLYLAGIWDHGIDPRSARYSESFRRQKPKKKRPPRKSTIQQKASSSSSSTRLFVVIKSSCLRDFCCHWFLLPARSRIFLNTQSASKTILSDSP